MIKFRLWDKVQKVMMVPRDMQTDSDGNIFYVEARSLDGEYDEGDLDVFELEQFTGLKDVNGKEIYEGDIIKYTSEDGAFFYAEVKYFADDNYPAFDFIPPDEDWRFQSNCLSEGTFSNALEVVGNVHANPELLEE